MKSLRKKIIYTVVLSVVCVIIYMIATLAANRLIFADKIRNRDAGKLDAINRMMDDLSSSLTEAEQKAADQYEVNAVLTAAALSNVISDEGDDAIEVYRSGAVVKIENSRFTTPADGRQDLGLATDLFDAEKGVFPAPGNPSTLIAYSRIGETPYYYVEWYDDTILADIVKQTINLSGILEEAEAAYGSRILLVKKEDAPAENALIPYDREDLVEYNDISETGLTQEAIEQSIGKVSQNLKLDGVTYMYSVGEVPSLNGYAILLVPETNIIRRSIDQAGGLVSILILILAGMVATGLSLYAYMLQSGHDIENEKRYRPTSVRRAAAVYGIIGLLVMGISSAYIYSLNGVREASENGRDALDMLEKRIALNISRDSSRVQNTLDSYIDHGNHISEIMELYPQLRAVTPLQELSDCIGASSITLYDHTGKEIVSSEGYIDMNLGNSPGTTTYDFRRILKGVPYIVHEAEKDETIGLTEVRIGIRMDDIGAQGKYGCMLISLDPAVMEQATTEEIGSALRYMSDEDTIFWIAESESGTILAASDDELCGRDIYSIGMGEYDLKEGLMKDIYMEDGPYFVLSSLLDDPVIAEGAERFGNSVAYYAVNRGTTNYGVLYTVTNCCVVFLAIYILLAWFLLKDYTEEFYSECQKRRAVMPAETGSAHGTEAAGSAVGAAVNGAELGPLAMIWRHLFGEDSYWNTRRPEQKGLIVTEIFVAFFLLQLLPVLPRNGIGHDTLYYYIISVGWERGINLFSFARIMILAGEIMLGVLLFAFLLRIVGRQIGTKGETVCELIISIVKYLSLATFVGLALYYLGMDKTTLLAALSILSLAVSLGSQNLVADIIAGISIIFSGVFDVGDQVVIGQYSGKVLEIGVRTTKILCAGNDILLIGNKDINYVLNKSKKNTVFDIPVVIRSDYPVDEIRMLLERELPGIGAKSDLILNGPRFEGISELSLGRITLCIVAECRQDDLGRAKLFINDELQKLFAKNGIRM